MIFMNNYPSVFNNMDTDPRISAQVGKLANRNEEWAKENNETVRELIKSATIEEDKVFFGPTE